MHYTEAVIRLTDHQQLNLLRQGALKSKIENDYPSPKERDRANVHRFNKPTYSFIIMSFET
jgi:hypothetical protein